MTAVSRRNWTADEVMLMEDLLEQGLSDEAIGRRLGRTAVAVNLARKRRGIRPRTEMLLSSRAVAAMLGKNCSKSVTRWIAMGLLRAKRGQQRGPYRQWYVSEQAVFEFMADPRSWPAWEPARIPDRALREWATEIRTERYFTPGEVADRFAVQVKTVNVWIARGQLRALRYGNWWIPESALAGFVPPCERSKAGMRLVPWAPHEVAELTRLREAGQTYQEIAAQLGRSLHSVVNRWLKERSAA